MPKRLEDYKSGIYGNKGTNLGTGFLREEEEQEAKEVPLCKPFPEGPSTQYFRTLVGKTYSEWYLGPES